MAAYKLIDFEDIYTAIAEELKVQLSDTSSINRIKRSINMIYLNEVIPASRWYWLSGYGTAIHPAYYGEGTVSINPKSTTVTLSAAPATSVGESGSFLNYLFSVDGTNEIYKILAHTAEATTFTLDKPYNGNTVTNGNFKIWKEDLELPADLRETVDVRHDHMAASMDAKGLQEFRKLVALGPKTEGRPTYYSTYDFRGTQEEDGRFRLLKVFPAISNYDTIIKFDYVREATALELDGDEPLIPIEDRIVLFYGALALAWASIGRVPEEAARNQALFDRKLAKMLGKMQDTMDKPRIEPDSQYMRSMRGGRIRAVGRQGSGAFSGGQSTFTSPSYLKNVTIEGANITDDVTVVSGVTIDGRDISADGSMLDAHVAADSAVHGVTGALVGTSDSQTLTNKTIDASLNTISNITDSEIDASAAIDRSKLAAGSLSAITYNDAVTGALSDSNVVVDELDYLQEVEALTDVTLTDDTSSPTSAVAWDASTYENIKLDYSLARGVGNREFGTIWLVTDGTSAGIAQAGASIGSCGVTLTTDISGGNIRLLYVTTNTGANATLKYKLHKW